jgi:hypothetical protein
MAGCLLLFRLNDVVDTSFLDVRMTACEQVRRFRRLFPLSLLGVCSASRLNAQCLVFDLAKGDQTAPILCAIGQKKMRTIFGCPIDSRRYDELKRPLFF